MVRVDPEFSSLLQVADERRNRIRKRLEDLLEEVLDREQREVSLLRLISRWLEILPDEGTYIMRDSLGPTVAFYERGHQVSEWGLRLAERPSVADLIAYLYYSARRRISLLSRTVWRLLCYIVTGAP